MRKLDYLYILSNGRVAAMDKKNGNIVWEIKLKDHVGSSMSMSIGQIMFEDNKLFLGAAGIVVCLNAKDGSLLWKNELKGWGYSFVSMANAGVEAPAQAQNQASANAAIGVHGS